MSKNEFDALLLKKLQDEAFEYDPKSWQQLSERLDASMPQLNEMHPFDTLLQQKLQEDSFEYNPKSWQQLSQSLDQYKEKDNEPKVIPFGKKWGIAIGTAAALCLFAGIGYLLNSGKTKVDNTSTLVHQQAAPQQSMQPSQNNAMAQPNNMPSPQPKAMQPSIVNPIAHQNKTLQNQAGSNTQPQITQPANSIPLQPNKVTEEQTPVQPQIAIQPKDTKNNIDAFNKAMTAPVEKTPLSNAEMAQRNASQNWPTEYEGANAGHKKAKTNLAMGGGVNYGNLNTGYTGAVTVKRKVGNDFFVDGTVGMMYNNNANNVAVNNGPSLNANSNLASRPTSSSISSPALAPIQRLYYVQFNPSFGYQIEDRVALSVGGDVQQMLGTKDEVVQPQNDNTKVFPTMDVGLTTKTEFTITPNLQAGLVYREGLNNLIKGSDNGAYVNRRYLQVQFKYNIPMGGK